MEGRLIGISGKKNSGKDLACDIIQSLTKDIVEWERIQFADKLKDCVCIILGCTRKDLENKNYKEKELGNEWWYYQFHFDEEFRLPYNDDPRAIDRHKERVQKLTPRAILQSFGTEFCREAIHHDIWINATFVDYYPVAFNFDETGETVEIYPNWLISDVRFPNEADRIKQKGGIVIRIDRFQQTDNEHYSEIALDNYENFDYLVLNDGTVDDLAEKLESILIENKII